MRSDSGRRCHVVIPARYGSSRLEGKPLIDLAGKPMIVRVHDNAAKAAGLTSADCDVTVATDDPRIAAALERHGIRYTMTDPDHRSGTDRVAEVARSAGWGEDDIIVNLQGDEPLFGAELIAHFLNFCLAGTTPSVFTACIPILSAEDYRGPNAVKVVLDCSGTALLFSRAPLPFARDRADEARAVEAALLHVGIYGYPNALLQRICQEPPCSLETIEALEQLRFMWMGIPIQVTQLDRMPGKGVDTPEDARLVAQLIEEQESSDG
ncbi:3-deoxy-manno-octulosonate cytidylyltransferase [Novosphingobium aquimarinum]|uniref:3-deoxy-manno-octulosonate cytidylyltransferase n=1 Tax=Novosphingobium aquimarinum TaxID=2682494 RepID=UPI0012EBFE13|nr:3-deoxy-manno-octulosonate cytidylyltransferase [Novosphingobium aquimarinum]